VLSLKDVTLFNTLITPSATLFVQNPKGVLGFHGGVNSISANKDGKPSKLKKCVFTLLFLRHFVFAILLVILFLNSTIIFRLEPEPVAFLRCFVELLDGSNDFNYKNFLDLASVALLSLRKQVSFLTWSLQTIGNQLSLSNEQVIFSCCLT
jgi:hypothetical protein